MKIGIVNMTGFLEGIKYIIKSIIDLGYEPSIIEYTTSKEIYTIISTSNIKNWIFSGSAHMVVDTTSPIVPLDILNLKHKKFMLICYSMESVLYQLGIPIKKRYENKKENFLLSLDMNKIKEINKMNIFLDLPYKLKLRRNHHYYIPSNFKKYDGLELVSSYRRESMIIFFKNSVLVQFHPERTLNGYKIINNWINSS